MKGRMTGLRTRPLCVLSWARLCLLLAAAGALAVVALGIRMMVEYSIMLDCRYCLVPPYLLSTAQFFLTLTVLFFLSLKCTRWLGYVLRLCIVVAGVIWVVDFYVLSNFLVRFDWRELLKFSADLSFVRGFIWNSSPLVLTAAVAALVVFCWGSLRLVLLDTWYFPWRYGLLAIGLLLASWLVADRGYHYVYVRNALLAFFDPPSIHKPYAEISAQERQALRQRYESSLQCRVMEPPVTFPTDRPKKVVLVMVESMSSYQSLYYGGDQDWWQHFDQWSTKGMAFTQFLANGKTTEDGLYATLTGMPPLLQPGKATVYESLLPATQQPLPRYLSQLGVHTAFLTTGNLAFMRKGEWLQRTGFETVEGHLADFYTGLPRFHFDAAEDRHLYARAWQWMQAQSGGYFLTIETVSTHQPYANPQTGEKSIRSAFTYADQALHEFLTKLEMSSFFEEGIVMVLGDHRAMVPASAAEREHLGSAHWSRVPLLVLGKGIPAGKETQQFSQQDVPNMVSAWMGGQVCTGPDRGAWTALQSQPAECAFTLRATHPSSSFVQCSDQAYELLLDGSDTRYLGAQGPTQMLDVVHYQRLGTQPDR